nr:Tetratricopeptide repeat protein 29 [Polyrhizophydium stewartii]
MPLTQTICIELLIEGHIHSFIDFFHMAVEDTIGIEFTSGMLEKLKQLLTMTEDSLRSGDASAIYESKKSLANFFLASESFDLAIAYFKEAHDTASRIQNNAAAEIEATRNLGLALEKAGQIDQAIGFLERSRSIAVDRGNAEGELRASQDLLEHSGNYPDAISHYAQCLDYLKHGAHDERSICDLEFRLGKANKEIGQIETAIKYLESFVSKAKTLNDKNKEGWAQATLASCYESSGNPQLAASYLQQFVAIAESDPTQRVAESQACNQLGMLFNKMGQFDLAVTYFERHFRLMTEITREEHGVGEDMGSGALAADESRSVAGAGVLDASMGRRTITPALDRSKAGTPSALRRTSADALSQPAVRVGAAQTQLGISRGNAQMAMFFETVVDQDGLASLLKWKAERSFGSYVPKRMETVG